MQTTGQAASAGGAAATAPQKEALYLRWHCASRRNALPVDRALDRALDRASESEPLVLDARSGIGGQDPTRRTTRRRRGAQCGGEPPEGAHGLPGGSMEQAR